MISHILLVGLGGFLGSVLRFVLSMLVNRHIGTYFPFGTFTVNVLGSLVIGILYGLWMREHIDDSASRLWITGFCGGFTTFSAFSYDLHTLINHQQPLILLLYTAGSILLGLAAVYLGISLVRMS